MLRIFKLCGTLLSLLAAESFAVELTLLGDFPGGRLSSSGNGTSADGSLICGNGELTLDPGEANEETVGAAFVWTAESGLTLLPFPQDLVGRRRAVARSMSDDGALIVGEARNFFNKDQPALWTRQADGSYTIELLNPPAGSPFSANVSANLDALAISGNGTVITGRGQTIPGEYEAWRWTRETGLVAIGNLSGGPIMKSGRTSYSSGEGLDRSGNHLIGLSWSGMNDDDRLVRQAFSYVGDTMTALGDLQDPPLASQGYGISKDGTTVVGQARDPDLGQIAFRKVGDAPMEALGQFPATSPLSIARAVNADGSVVIGESNTDRDREAFLWRADSSPGITSLSDLVTIEGGYLETANAISDDGLIIVGTVIYPDENNQNEREAYRLKLDAPILASPSLPTLALTALDNEVLLTFSASSSTATFTLEFSPDLAQGFTPMVSFQNDTREILSVTYEGSSVSLSPVTESLPKGGHGFWRLRMTLP